MVETNGKETRALEKDSSDETARKPAPLLGSHRLTLFLLLMFGLSSSMFLRQNINFALVCMVKPPQRNVTEVQGASLEDEFSNATLRLNPAQLYDSAVDYRCELPEPSTNGTNPHTGEFEWSKETQASVLGSFFYGFIITQVLGGWMTDRFGGKIMFLSTTAVFSLLTLLNPLAATWGPPYLFAIRLIQGFSQGAAFPCINMLAIRWSDPDERGFLVGIAYGGVSIGAAITYPVCAIICETLGWKYIFYISGGFGILWCVVSWFTIFDWPENHPRISQEELAFLKRTRSKHLDITRKKLKVPWMKIATSLPLNALNVVHFCTLWSYHTLSMYLPAYMNEVLRMDVRSNGIISSLPHVAMLIVHLGIGKLFDKTRRKNFCSITTLRKIYNTIGTIFPSFALVAVIFLSCNAYILAMTAMSAGQAMVEFALMGGYLLSVMELAPAYAGILTGVMNMFGVIPGFLCPAAVAYLTQGGTRDEWLNVFYLGAGINMFGGLVYLLFGSGETQPWAALPSRPADPETGQKLLSLKTNVSIAKPGNAEQESQ